MLSASVFEPPVLSLFGHTMLLVSVPMPESSVLASLVMKSSASSLASPSSVSSQCAGWVKVSARAVAVGTKAGAVAVSAGTGGSGVSGVMRPKEIPVIAFAAPSSNFFFQSA